MRLPRLLPSRPAIGLSVAGLAVVFAAGSQAASTSFWLVSTQAEFLRGDPQQVAIDSDGRVTLGPALETLHDVASPSVWRLLPGDGGVVWAATGNDGKLWRVGGGEPRAVFDATELDLHALATSKAGVFVGSSPDGRVYRVTADGTSSIVFDPEEKYIWSLAAAPDDTLYVGTGEPGRIYKVTPDGKGALFYDPQTVHVTALALDGKGHLFVGTSSPGRIMRIDAEGKAFVLLESAYKEVRSLRIAPDGVVYATAAGAAGEGEAAPRAPEPTGPTPIPTVSTEITVAAVGDSTIVTPATSGVTETRPPSGPQKGAVYRIRPDGEWAAVWESPDDLPYDVFVEPSGSLLVATGPKGKLYRLAGSPTLITLVTRVDAQQITAISGGPSGRLLLSTANPGRLLQVESAPAGTGSYLSDVRDTTTIATWGALRWRATVPASTKLELFTRAGNTKTPDKTWSDWSEAYSDPQGSTISSPKARYLQWKAVFTGARGASPVLTSVTVAYLPRNTRPVVENITVHPPGVVFQRPFPTGDPELAGFESNTMDGRPPVTPVSGQSGGNPALGRRTFQKSLQTFVWQARDADGDRLQYDVLYRLEGEPGWRVLKRGLFDEILTWDTTSVPDGTYVIKVVASDLAANAPAFALQGERESGTFDVDNTPPAIDAPGMRTGARSLAFAVRDSHSPIQRVEYSVNAGRWQLAYPVDGLLDSREERFDLTLPEGATGAVVLRVTDTLGNVATAVVSEGK